MRPLGGMHARTWGLGILGVVTVVLLLAGAASAGLPATPPADAAALAHPAVPIAPAPRGDELPVLGGAACPEGGDHKAACLLGWDHGASPGFGDDAFTVGLVVRVAPGSMLGALGVDALGDGLVPPAPADGPLPCAPVAGCGPVAADADLGAVAAALAGTLEPLRSAGPAPGSSPTAQGKSSTQDALWDLWEPTWLIQLPAVHLEAGVAEPLANAAARAAGAAPASSPGGADASPDDREPRGAAADTGSPSSGFRAAPAAPARVAPALVAFGPLASAVAAAAALAGAPSAQAVALVGGAALGASLLLAWGLYTRVAAHRALDQATRRRIYDLVAQQPGVRVGTLRRQLGLSYPAVERHVRLLLQFGLLEALPGGQRRLFVCGATDAPGRVAVVASSTPQARRVLEYLRERGAPAPLRELRADLRLPRSTASLLVRRLAAAGLVGVAAEGRQLTVGLPAAAPPQVALVTVAPAGALAASPVAR